MNLSITTPAAARNQFAALADPCGHLRVLDSLDRPWVLVEIAGVLRIRPYATGSAATDSRTVSTLTAVLDDFGPLTVDPAR